MPPRRVGMGMRLATMVLVLAAATSAVQAEPPAAATASGAKAAEKKPDAKSEAKQAKSAAAAATPAPAKVKIVLIGTAADHPYSTHMYMHECRLLATCLKQTPGVEPVVVQDWPDAVTLEGVRALVFYSRPAGDIVLNPKTRDKFQKLMADGVGYTAIHWATGAEKKNGEEYLKFLGGWFHTGHTSKSIETQTLEQLDRKHPICRGWQDYRLRDEFYINLKFHPRAAALARVSVSNPNVPIRQPVVAWTFERPGSKGGRSFGTTLGHFHENFGITAFRKLLVNGILWSAHIEIPADGAPVAVTTRDLELPPPVPPKGPRKK